MLELFKACEVCKTHKLNSKYLLFPLIFILIIQISNRNVIMTPSMLSSIILHKTFSDKFIEN